MVVEYLIFLESKWNYNFWLSDYFSLVRKIYDIYLIKLWSEVVILKEHRRAYHTITYNTLLYQNIVKGNR